MATTSDNLKLTDLYVFDEKSATIRVPDTSVVEDSVIEDTRAALGADVDTTTSTPVGRMIEWWTVNFKNVININMQNANQLMVSSAAGQQLDCIADWFGLARKGNSRTSVSCRITGTAGTTVYSGAQARSRQDDVYTLKNDVTIGDDGYVDGAIFVCNIPGPVVCPKSSLVIIETPTAGWSTVVNNSDGAVGRLIESDEDLRSRIIHFKDDGVGFLNSIKTAIDKVESVNSSVVIENNTGDELDVRGVAMDPHSIFVCVDNVTTGEEGNEKLIGQAIFNTKPCGTGYTKLTGLNGNSTTLHEPEVDDGYGNKYKVYFHHPEPCKIKMNLVIRNRSYTGQDIVADVKSAILAWAENTTYEVGETVYGSDIISAVESSVSGVIVVNAIVNDAGIDYETFKEAVYVDVPANKKAAFTWTEKPNGDITVEQV